MKKALISPTQGNKICEVVQVQFPVASPLYWVLCPDTVTPEWTYDGQGFNPPVVEEPEILTVSMRQARLALLQGGYLSSIDTIIDSLDEPLKSAAKIEWEYAAEVDKRSPLVAIMKQALTLSNQELTDLFNLANTL